MRPTLRLAGFVPAMVLLAAGMSCGGGDFSAGVDPPDDAFYFPQGSLLDPRVDTAPAGVCTPMGDECAQGQMCVVGQCRTPPRWMFVSNANSDLRFNGGTLTAVDLDAFFAALDGEIRGPSAELDADHPCRRDALDTDLVECDERFFIEEDSTIHTGSFTLTAAGWDCEVEKTHRPVDGSAERTRTLERHCGEGEATLLIPVNGDPSIVPVTLSGNGVPDLDCGQGGESDPRRCAPEQRLRYVRNDEERSRLPREMSNILVSPDPRFPLAYVAHESPGLGTPGAVTLVRLDGLSGVHDPGDVSDPISAAPPTPVVIDDPLPPAIVDVGALFGGDGGFGLAQRPCDPNDPPATTVGCSTPLVYATHRNEPRLASFTARRLRPTDLAPSQTCAGPDQAADKVAVICDEVVQAETSDLFDGASTRVGELHLSRDGTVLYGVQQAAPIGQGFKTGASAIIRINVRLDVFGEPIREGTNAYTEVCDGASALAIYDDGVDLFGLVSCWRSAQVFIVDLHTMRAVTSTIAGAGANRMTVDLAREVVYVANTLDATLSVIDMSSTSLTRFHTSGRLGLSEPFSQ